MRTRNWKTFWDLFRESIIVQSLVTLVMITVLCIMYLRGMDIPEGLWGATMLILGFWFGSKTSLVQKQ